MLIVYKSTKDLGGQFCTRHCHLVIRFKYKYEVFLLIALLEDRLDSFLHSNGTGKKTTCKSGKKKGISCKNCEEISILFVEEVNGKSKPYNRDKKERA